MRPEREVVLATYGIVDLTAAEGVAVEARGDIDPEVLGAQLAEIRDALAQVLAEEPAAG